MGEKVGETVTTTVLRMVFTMEDGKSLQMNLANPADGLTTSTVDDFMNEAIEDRLLLKGGVEATNIKDRYIYQTNKIDLA